MNGDSEYAYGFGNTKTAVKDFDKRKGGVMPIVYNVIAITEEGTIVHHKNIMDYMNADCLTIDV